MSTHMHKWILCGYLVFQTLPLMACPSSNLDKELKSMIKQSWKHPYTRLLQDFMYHWERQDFQAAHMGFVIEYYRLWDTYTWLKGTSSQNRPLSSVPMEAILAVNLLKSAQAELTWTVPGMQMMNLFSVRPPQVELARMVKKHGNLTPETKMLEIGYGIPSVVQAFGSMVARSVGIDVIDISSYVRNNARVFPMVLFQGNAPKDAPVSDEVKRLGPYHVISAGDVLKEHTSMGEEFIPGVDPHVYLKFWADQLVSGGRWIILNDSEMPVVYTREQFEAVGLDVVHWGLSHRIDSDIVAYVSRAAPCPPRFGSMLLYVLQKR